MRKYNRLIFALTLFFIVPIFSNRVFPSLGVSSTINLIARLGINGLLLLTFIYLFYEEIVTDLEKINTNKRQTIINIIVYLYMLIIGFIIASLIGFLITKKGTDSLFQINYLYQKIPIYLFINTIIIYPLLDNIMYRLIPKKIIKSKLAFILISTFIFAAYSAGKIIIDYTIIPYLFTGCILSLAFLKTENIITLTITNLIFNCLLFILNYF